MIIVFIVLSVFAVITAIHNIRPEWPMPVWGNIVINECMALGVTLVYGILVHFAISIIKRKKRNDIKNFKPKAWLLPQPVLILGTYDADGTPNAMNAAWGGQWDMNEIMISMGSHATTENLNRCQDFTVTFATVDTMVAADYVGIVSDNKQR